jgi:endonuclease/exonuclease/phosphatase family metal-dependent hydrolase
VKKLSFFDKLVFFINSIFSVALLLAYLLPYIPPKTSAFLSLLSLGVPFLIVVNLVFLVYWVIRLKKQALLPLIVLLIGLHHVFSLFNFSSETDSGSTDDEFTVMSYNVRSFNRYEWLDKKNVPEKIKSFLEKSSPDILSIQDYYKTDSISIDNFPYSYIHTQNKNSVLGQAIFSKYPIVNKGSLDFPNTFNNAVFADIAMGNDTVRVFNLHLESLKIIPEKILKEEISESLVKRVGHSFEMQQEQMEILLKAVEKSPYKNIVCADMNNSAFSYVYRQLEENGFKDAFKEAGNGFGKTFDFDFIPLRIDMIFVESSIQVVDFKNYGVKLSDHYPIMARVEL